MGRGTIGAAVLAAALLGACASSALPTPEEAFGDAPGDVSTDTPPPPAPEREVAPPAPRDDFVWNEGYWEWGRGQYMWIPGNWVPPRPGWVWIPNRWVWRDHRWHWRGGHWRRA